MMWVMLKWFHWNIYFPTLQSYYLLDINFPSKNVMHVWWSHYSSCWMGIKIRCTLTKSWWASISSLCLIIYQSCRKNGGKNLFYHLLMCSSRSILFLVSWTKGCHTEIFALIPVTWAEKYPGIFNCSSVIKLGSEGPRKYHEPRAIVMLFNPRYDGIRWIFRISSHTNIILCKYVRVSMLHNNFLSTRLLLRLSNGDVCRKSKP